MQVENNNKKKMRSAQLKNLKKTNYKYYNNNMKNYNIKCILAFLYVNVEKEL